MEEIRSPKGFSIVDLLLMIAIIAVLSVIVVPLVMYMSKSSSKGQCASNMGELGKALSVYTTDNGGRLPYWWKNHVTWDTCIRKYVKNNKSFVCPANTSSAKYPSTTLIRSYAMPKNVSGVKPGQAPKPSLTVLLFEKGTLPLGSSGDACGESFYQISANRANRTFWHGDGKTFAFLDGHVTYWRAPGGPFSYNYPNLVAWSTARFRNNPGGPGYCGWADNTADGGDQGSGNTCLPGANIPQ